MNVDGIINSIEEIVGNAKKAPLFLNGYLMDQEQLLELLDDLRDSLPGDIAEARQILEDQETIREKAEADAADIRAKAEEEAAAIEDDARRAAEDKINESEIMQEAQARAEELLTRAQHAADETRRSASQYVDDILSDMEVYIKHQLEIVQKDRGQMQGR